MYLFAFLGCFSFSTFLFVDFINILTQFIVVISLIFQFDLVCDDKALPEMAQSIFAAGFLTGSFVFGFLADW